MQKNTQRIRWIIVKIGDKALGLWLKLIQNLIKFSDEIKLTGENLSLQLVVHFGPARFTIDFDSDLTMVLDDPWPYIIVSTILTAAAAKFSIVQHFLLSQILNPISIGSLFSKNNSKFNLLNLQ